MKWYSYFRNCFSLIFVLHMFNTSFAQKPSANLPLQIIPDETEASITQNNMRLNEITGVPFVLYKPNYPVNADTPENMAKQFLNENHELFKLSADLSELKYFTTKETPGGYHVHFDQYIGEYPVLNSRVNVTISRDNRVVFVTNGSKINYKNKVVSDLERINISSEQALISAKNYLGLSGSVAFEKSEPGIYYKQGIFRLAQVVTIVPAEELFGQWEILVDAQTGEIFRVEDKACYFHPAGYNPQLLDGSGYVFDPDPITHARTTYGSTGFLDNNDADSDSLTFHRELRTLYDISFEGGVYILKGPWAEVRDFESPFTGLHTNPTSDFLFTRSDDNFEAVNTYYHIDNSMRWINNSLSFPLIPYQYTGGVRFDPHGLNGDDNSHYLSGTGSIAYGDGGVDDAEDLGVVLHELGHGIHDWVTNGSLSQVEGLSEGCGDYWATSYIRSTGYWTPSYPAYNWVFIWDGHNPFWAGRITNYTAHYPEGLTGSIHTDGQMWASSLMSIYDLIGQIPTDKNFLEALSMTNGSSGQVDAANAFIAADQLLYSGSHLAQIIPVFVARGYITGPITPDFIANVTSGSAPLTVQFTDLSISQPNPIISWEWDFDNNGTVDATTQNPSWTYTDFGFYSVKLTVSDGTNTASELKSNYITVTDPNVIEWCDAFTNLSNWTVVGPLGTTNWTSNNSNSSGGSAPELRMSWTPQFDGESKIRSSVISLPNNQQVSYSFNYYFDWYANPSGTITVAVTYDGGATSSVLYSQVDATGNVGPGLIAGNFITPASGAQNTQVEITFNGNSFNNDNIYWDNLCVGYVVPVELSSFNATSNGADVELKWITSTETNNQGFEIERVSSQTSPVQEWVQVGYVAGFGTVTEPKAYSFVDSRLEA
ncbi:MAG: PKD domain-containing protein, partial [Ignavibacteriaceae bacterium]|nr:PKD domain-containing protein [Ignavibacteriaceae bacterium]